MAIQKERKGKKKNFGTLSKGTTSVNPGKSSPFPISRPPPRVSFLCAVLCRAVLC